MYDAKPRIKKLKELNLSTEERNKTIRFLKKAKKQKSLGMKINNKRWMLFEIDAYLTDIEKRNCFNLADNI